MLAPGVSGETGKETFKEKSLRLFREQLKRPCRNCGKEFVPDYRSKTQKFCKKACCDAYRWRHPYPSKQKKAVQGRRQAQA
ncbi:MAG TPA: hypothetical protein VI729_08480 [Anaerolineales bacterium]|nr:hypothetical protein [Anaerolineales bacterium]